MKAKIYIFLLIIFLTSIVFANYVPKPADDPMGSFTVYKGEIFTGEFLIEDASGPVGYTIICEPEGLIIDEPNITNITGGDGEILAREYIYRFKYIPEQDGEKIFTITATDSLGISASAKIRFEVAGNAQHVFTGCREIKSVVSDLEPVNNNEAWTEYDVQWRVPGFDSVHQMKKDGYGIKAQFVKIN